MADRLITEQGEFDELCSHIREEGIVAFDTEFVSEFTHRPELALLQFATPKQVAAVDPYEVRNLDSWWSIMADDTTTVVVHGGQAEVRFCTTLAKQLPQLLIDVQIAEGMRSRSYPLGYVALVDRVLRRGVHGKETRTDWRRRPLTASQIQYALEDVKHVLEVWQRQRDSLDKLGRLSWAEAEFHRMVHEVHSESTRESWQRLPGIHRLSAREFAVACEIADWREQEAQKRDRPARRILRDDLIVELAKRQPLTVDDLLVARDLNRTDYRRIAPDLIDCVTRAKKIPESDLPDPPRLQSVDVGGDDHVLAQLLSIALTNRCTEMNVAKSIVGTSADLRDFVRWHLMGRPSGHHPRLTIGWRAEVCGDLLSELLTGKISLRVDDPESDHPLIFEKTRRARSRSKIDPPPDAD